MRRFGLALRVRISHQKINAERDLFLEHLSASTRRILSRPSRLVSNRDERGKTHILLAYVYKTELNMYRFGGAALSSRKLMRRTRATEAAY